MLQVGDIVKVIAPTMFNGELTELIPVGAFCKVMDVEREEDAANVVVRFYTSASKR